MNVVGIIALSLLAGIVLVVIIGGLVTLVLLHLRVQKSQTELVKALTEFTSKWESSSGQAVDNLERLMEDAGKEFCDIAVQYKTELVGVVESARSSFGGIRQDIKTSQENQTNSIGIVLKAHAERFEAAMSRINGEALTRASIEALRALRELSALTVTLKNLLVDHQSPAAELGPEEYGPSDELFVGQSDTARLDDVAARDEATIYATQFSDATVRTEQ